MTKFFNWLNGHPLRPVYFGMNSLVLSVALFSIQLTVVSYRMGNDMQSLASRVSNLERELLWSDGYGVCSQDIDSI